MTAAGTPTETCARCGEPFGCGAAVGSCWCATVDVAPDVLRDLDRRYDGCLCPSCLATAARGSITPPSPATREAGA